MGSNNKNIILQMIYAVWGSKNKFVTVAGAEPDKQIKKKRKKLYDTIPRNTNNNFIFFENLLCN